MSLSIWFLMIAKSSFEVSKLVALIVFSFNINILPLSESLLWLTCNHDSKKLSFLYLSTFPLAWSEDPNDPNSITDNTRKLGLVVCRGTQVSLISPEDGMEEIANPFLGDDE